jgi:hypothetical protein
MIQMATMVEDNQMIGIPAWTATESDDIDGKTESTEPVTQEQKSDIMMVYWRSISALRFTATQGRADLSPGSRKK